MPCLSQRSPAARRGDLPFEGALHANQQSNNAVTHHEKSSMTELPFTVFGWLPRISIPLVSFVLLWKMSVPCSLSFPSFSRGQNVCKGTREKALNK
jgi:hypothetical protein